MLVNLAQAHKKDHCLQLLRPPHTSTFYYSSLQYQIRNMISIKSFFFLFYASKKMHLLLQMRTHPSSPVEINIVANIFQQTRQTGQLWSVCLTVCISSLEFPDASLRSTIFFNISFNKNTKQTKKRNFIAILHNLIPLRSGNGDWIIIV